MDGLYTLASAADMVPVVTATAFAAGNEGWIAAVEAGRVRLPPVRCRRIAPDGAGPPRLRTVRAQDVPMQRPIGMPDDGPGFRDEVAHPALTVSCLHGAVCLPGGVVVRNNTVLLNSFAATWDAREHRHLQRAADGRWQLASGQVFDPARLSVVVEPVLHLDHQHIDWFGHVIADLLSPGWAYEYCRAFLGVERLLVLCSAPRYAFVRHLLTGLGVPDRDLVLIDGPVLCRRLLLATKAMQVQGYVSAPAVRLWQGMRNRMVPGPPAADRVYVSRRANPTRRLVEEEAVEAVFAAHGFRIFHPEGHDIREQMGIFAGARLIAGCSGSNLFNLAFQGRAEAVLVLVSPLLIHRSEQFLCARPGGGGASLDVLIGYVREGEMARHPGWVHAPWHLDPVLVADVVADWLRAAG